VSRHPDPSGIPDHFSKNFPILIFDNAKTDFSGNNKSDVFHHALGLIDSLVKGERAIYYRVGRSYLRVIVYPVKLKMKIHRRLSHD
jgi:hypothetical protein